MQMKNKRAIWIIGGVLICGLALVVGQFFLSGCFWWECVPERDFHVLDWEVPTYLFPNDATSSQITPSSEGAGEIERGSQSVFWSNDEGLARYEISRYATLRAAIRAYEFQVEQLVNDVTKAPWTQPNEIGPFNSLADEMLIGCGIWSVQRCGMVARYQEYVIFFSTVIDEKMTYTNIEKAMIYIDEKISDRLYP